MKKLLMAIAAVLTILAATPHATASPITYTFSGASVTFGAAGTDTITGSFAYDSSVPTQQLSNVNITVAGPVYPSVSSVSYCTPCAPPNNVYFGPPGDILDYIVAFGSNLNGSAAPLTYASFYNNSTPSVGPFQTYTVSGSALPTVGNGSGAQTITEDFPDNGSQYSFVLSGSSNEPTYLSFFDTSPDTNNVELSVVITPLYPEQVQNTYACSILNPCDVFTELVNTLVLNQCNSSVWGSCEVTATAIAGIRGQPITIEANDNLPPGAQLATPLPAALPLFAIGLGGLGLLGWRRKRANTSALAA
jgi:hypothetical protein